MPYGYPHDQGDTRGPQSVRLDWKSALTGGMLVMVVAYVGLVAPAWRQVRALEGHVARLAASVEALNESRDGVSRATSLLERLEAQAARLAAAERTLERFETLGDRLVAEADSVEAAGTTMDRIDELHHGIVASGSAISEAEAALADIDALSVRVAATRETARETATSLGVRVVSTAAEVPDEWADIIISNNALEHTTRPLDELRSLFPKLKRGGRIVFVVPNESIRCRYAPGDVNQHLYSWSPMSLGNLFTHAGFKVDESKPFLHKWPRNNFRFWARFGSTFFHTVCRAYARWERSWFQVRVIAHRPHA